MRSDVWEMNKSEFGIDWLSAKAIEDRLRTYLAAGVDPIELRQAAVENQNRFPRPGQYEQLGAK